MADVDLVQPFDSTGLLPARKDKIGYHRFFGTALAVITVQQT
jgi:hypothetical protein